MRLRANTNSEVCKTDYPDLRFIEGWIIIHRQLSSSRKQTTLFQGFGMINL